MDHSDRVAQEISFFQDMDLNALPEIYNYWANQHLIHFVFAAFGSYNLFEIFARELGESVKATGNPVIVSIGSGDAEIDQIIAVKMLELGYTDFQFECLELSTFLIDRAKERMQGSPVAAHFTFIEADLSNWKPERAFGACFAHHSLHHIVALEHVFDQIKENLAPGGSFLTSDMIGRNGHMRWPETLAIINALWTVVPAGWKHNRQLKRLDKEFVNWDCSTHGFEGVRAQDILPLLVERFHFHKFSAWGGILDPFIERALGHNLHSTVDYDRAFVDTLWQTNRSLVKLGSIKPTQLIAVMKNEPGPLISSDGLEPSACVRHRDAGLTYGETVDLTARAAMEVPPMIAVHAREQTDNAQLGDVVLQRPHPLAITGAQSGSWYDPRRNGEGFQLEIGTLDGGRQIVASWHTYRDRKPIWLTGTAELQPGSTTVTVPMIATSGANFGSEFRAEDVAVEQWGNITLSFPDSMRMDVRYDPAIGRGGTLHWQRLLECIEGLRLEVPGTP